ncbi:glycoside hydrolase family 48 protein [Paenibacillus macerans]|uniref:Exoglucanase-2 n=1 Tax=Paenibacillus macerans TaxID=44252 RepID=A0A090ZC04_PAEMA|nr:glycoside hydrolase family 48 protein [Paenibacillus macerans]KFN07943.1 exoglucanase-2 [Paenibacillus macerans]MCY7556796.1 cellulose 1,4-beta-cellobiosidase [Paenibacillus macerans]MEC0152056.1 glycoside hydrolase family 48 protein [Paenibacillus macerans]SUA85008.1 putative cellulose 1,4-beta-cellobiosidase [Paenibacillus macerans]
MTHWNRCRKPASILMTVVLSLSVGTGLFGSGSGRAAAEAAAETAAKNAAATVSAQTGAASTERTRFLQLYDQIKDPANGYFSAEGIPYHSVETLMSEAPNYGHMTTSEAYSYWMWLEVLYGYYTEDWSKLEEAWDNMEKYIIPVNEGDGKEEQPTMNYYNPNSPATYAAEYPQPDRYPSDLTGQYAGGKDPLDAELKKTYGNNQTYLMHWLLDVDNWYGFGNLLNPNHTAAYVNTFQRGEQESVWEAIPHPSQDDKSFGKAGEGFMSLFTKENQAPAAQWRYTNATDADARAVQAMYWAKELGYDNEEYLDKARKMGDYLRYGMYDKYFQEIGSAADGSPTPGNGKNASHYLMAWYTSWGGGLGNYANWAWRIGASHAHQGYQNVVAAYALSNPDGGLIPESPTAGQDWDTSLKRQLEFYTWLQSAEGAIAGGATNSWDGAYKAYPAGTSTFYGMAYDGAPVYHDPPSNNWFGMQAWPVERIAELYYILASNGDTSSENFQMAKQVLDKWIDWSMDYVFVDSRPASDADGYYLDEQGKRVLGGQDPQIATVEAPGELWIPGNLEWQGQPETWNGFDNHAGNPNLHVVTKDPGQDFGVIGSYVKALTFYAAGTKAENGKYTELGEQAEKLAKNLLDASWNYNDGVGITKPEPRKDYYRYFTKEIYFPAGWSGKYGQGNTIPGTNSVPSDPSKGGNGVYISYYDLLPEIKNDPDWKYLEDKYNTSWNAQTGKWENGAPEFTYHRFWSQVDMATAYAEYDRLINGGGGPGEPTAPKTPTKLKAEAGDAQVSLSWSKPAGANSYTVKRATVSGGPYTEIATVTNAVYLDQNVVNDQTYYYVVNAANDIGVSPDSAEVSATPTEKPKPVEGDLKLKYQTNDSNPNDNHIRAQFKIVNNGKETVNLSDVKFRYYFTIDGDKPQEFHCDYAVVGSGNVRGTFVKLNESAEGADYYLEVSFGPGAGTLAPGADSGEIQVRFNKTDWSNYSETDDFSYDATKTSYTEWERVPLYLNGTLVWGLEP